MARGGFSAVRCFCEVIGLTVLAQVKRSRSEIPCCRNGVSHSVVRSHIRYPMIDSNSSHGHTRR